MKKIAAVMMVIAMITALTIPVIAEGGSESTNSNGGSYGGVTITPTINIECLYSNTSVVDNSASAMGPPLILNPYRTLVTQSTTYSANGSSVAFGESAYVDPDKGSTAQVIALPLVFKSESNCAISVGVKDARADRLRPAQIAAGTTLSSLGDTNKVNIVNKIPSGPSATLDTFLYLEGVALGSDDEYQAGTDVGEYADDDAHLALTTTATTNIKELFTLPVPAEAGKSEYGQIGIGGWLQSQITDGAERSSGVPLEWTTGDTASVYYTLVVVPVVITE